MFLDSLILSALIVVFLKRVELGMLSLASLSPLAPWARQAWSAASRNGLSTPGLPLASSFYEQACRLIGRMPQTSGSITGLSILRSPKLFKALHSA